MNGTVEMKSLSALDQNVKIIEQNPDEEVVIKVAAYCRISKDVESQHQSLATQIEAYQRVISEHPGWVLAGIYADKGISGTTVKKRKEFLRMIEDAKAGKIQYILAKSISRFARNTVDVLAYVRELKSYGVSVYFEKEKIDTGNAVSEFVLSIYAASAQEEIISLSNNMKMGRRMRYAEGVMQWTHLYGLRCAKDGSWVIEESEAQVIRRIFNDYINGKTTPVIERELMAEGIPSVGGQAKWYQSSISEILKNEKYAGDLRMQKTYTEDPITHVKRFNRDGKLKQYYKEDHHPAIVSKDVYRMATMTAALRDRTKGVQMYPFYGFLKCPICGAEMVRFHVPRDTTTYAWTCPGQTTEKGTTRKDRSSCPPFFIVENYVHQGFREAAAALDRGQLTEITKGRNQKKADAAAALLRLKDNMPVRKQDLLYKDLYETVESIVFPQWTVMKINWKCGLKSTVQIEYKRVGDYPCTEIQMVTLTKRKKTYEKYLANEEPVDALQARSILKTQKEVLSLIILEPNDYQAIVPSVYDSRCLRRKEKWRAKMEEQNESAEI